MLQNDDNLIDNQDIPSELNAAFPEDLYGYQKLNIWKRAADLSLHIHELTLQLPKFEMFEEGSQIRRSAKGIRSAIVEGYGRKKYKADFLRFLHYSYASCLETRDHLDIIHETGSFTDKQKFLLLKQELEILSKMIYRYIKSVEKNYT